MLLRGALAQAMYYVEAPRDGRAVFVMPWQGATLLGTTERIFEGEDPGGIQPTEAEIEYLLEIYTRYFPRRPIELLSALAGLRVPPRLASTAFHRTRDSLLVTDRARAPRLLSVVGGKLTAYRATAERAIRALRPALPARHAVADTRALPLTPVSRSAAPR